MGSLQDEGCMGPELVAWAIDVSGIETCLPQSSDAKTEMVLATHVCCINHRTLSDSWLQIRSPSFRDAESSIDQPVD